MYLLKTSNDITSQLFGIPNSRLHNQKKKPADAIFSDHINLLKTLKESVHLNYNKNISVLPL